MEMKAAPPEDDDRAFESTTSVQLVGTAPCTVTVYLRATPSGEYGPVEARAHTSGAYPGLAITPFENDESQGLYSITHIQSGGRLFSSGVSLARAADIAERLAGGSIDWTLPIQSPGIGKRRLPVKSAHDLVRAVLNDRQC